MNINFMQTGEGHCWLCHQTYNKTHDCSYPLTTQPTECTVQKCGIWYSKRMRYQQERFLNIDREDYRN